MPTATAPPRPRLARIRLRLVVVVRAGHEPLAPVRRGGRKRAAAVAMVCGVVVAAAVQLATGWAIRTDRVPLRDPMYLDKLALLRQRPAFAPGAHTGDTRLVILGSSRSLDGIDAGAVGRDLTARLGRPVAAFNFAHPGAGPVLNALYLRRLLSDGATPDAVLIEVHPALIGARPESLESRWVHPARLRPEELPLARGMGFPAREPDTHGPRGHLLPWSAYRLALIDRYAPALSVVPFPVGARQPCDEHGFFRCRTVTPAERARLLELTRKQYAEYLTDYAPGGTGVAGLRDALETCRANDIRAALVLTPESSEFRSWYPEPGRARIGPVVADLAREFGAPVFDCREWLPDDLTGDGHHLTGPGADAFTARLSADALAPWLAKGGAP